MSNSGCELYHNKISTYYRQNIKNPIGRNLAERQNELSPSLYKYRYYTYATPNRVITEINTCFSYQVNAQMSQLCKLVN